MLDTQVWANADAAPDHMRQHFAPQLRAFLMQRLNFGSYPEVVTSNNPTQLLRELGSDYLWKDVLQTGLVKTPDLIKRLLLLLAHQTGAEVSVSELATQLQMARPTVDRYLDLLEQTFVIFRLPSFSTNSRKEIAKSRKVFFWDTGIRTPCSTRSRPTTSGPTSVRCGRTGSSPRWPSTMPCSARRRSFSSGARGPNRRWTWS